MTYQKITLTQNSEYIAIKSGSHKTDLITIQISKQSIFDGASLLETRALTDKNNNIAFDDETAMVDNAGTQIEISTTQQITRSVSNKNIWYIFKLQNATLNTRIQICTSGIEVKYSETAIIENL